MLCENGSLHFKYLSMEFWAVEYVHENCFSGWLPVTLDLSFPNWQNIAQKYCLVFSSPLENT